MNRHEEIIVIYVAIIIMIARGLGTCGQELVREEAEEGRKDWEIKRELDDKLKETLYIQKHGISNIKKIESRRIRESNGTETLSSEAAHEKGGKNYLFIHQNFPGQWKHIAKALAENQNNNVI